MIDNQANNSQTRGRFPGDREVKSAEAQTLEPVDRRKHHELRTTVLVVDSDPSAVFRLSAALRLAGYATLEATSFPQAKELLVNQSPQVLVTDVRLGQFNGLQLLMRARSDRPDLHAIITCPFPDAVLEAETRRFGGNFLIKPIEPWQIIDGIRSASRPQVRVPDPVPPLMVERRQSERRKAVIHNFAPERRIGDRRASDGNAERRRADRRQTVIQGHFPERRKVNRRFLERV